MKLPMPITINFVTIYKLIRKSMWFKRWFCKSVAEVPQVGKKQTALLYAINDYPGNQNDLHGCLNDSRDVAKELDALYPGFKIKAFTNNKATRNSFLTEVPKAIKELRPEDFLLVHYSGHGTQVIDIHGDDADGYDEGICLIDGVVIDDDIKEALLGIPDGATVLLMFDSCFSGTITKDMNNAKIKFMPPPVTRKKKRKKIVRIPRSEMKWIVMSGCREDQTSADAFINGEYHGAFTYYALRALIPGITYRQWIDKIHKYLPSQNFEQVPTLEGRESLFDKKIFT
jgi:hypothetical protein